VRRQQVSYFVSVIGIAIWWPGCSQAEPPAGAVASLLDHGKWVPTPVRTIEQVQGFRPTATVELSRYGGWKARRVKATGFFRTEQVDGRWWLVDPEGYLFLSVGRTPRPCFQSSVLTERP